MSLYRVRTHPVGGWKNGVKDMRRGGLAAGVGIVAVLAATAAWAQYGYQPYPGFPQVQEQSGISLALERCIPSLVAGVCGFVFGAFFSPLAAGLRKGVGIVLAVAMVLATLFAPPPIGGLLSYVAAWVLFLIAVFIGFNLGRSGRQVRRERPTSFGSAKWATLEYLRRKEVIGTAGFTLGEFVSREGVNPMSYNGKRHLLTVAPTRSGKGVSSIIPNLLRYGGSALVVDPKGENALITAAQRQAMGQKVFLLDPWGIAGPKLGMTAARFNPLDWIQPDDPDAVENALLLAEAMVPSGAEGEARFWDEEARSLIAGIILYVATAPDEKERTLGRVRDILTMDEETLKDTLQAMFNHGNPVVASTASRTASKDPKLRSSVLASAQSHTHFLESPRIRESLSATDFHFESLKTDHVSVYLILPADRLQAFDRWLRLLIQQALTVNARNVDVNPDRPILFMLDEMAAIGRLAMLEQAFGLMAGYGMQIWGIVQDLSQLSRIYGQEGWQTFISNSGVIQYFGSRDKMTAEYFSSLCGVTTILVKNLSWAISRTFGSSSTSGAGSSSSSTSSSDTSSETATSNESQRQLAYPDELMVLHEDEQIIFVENLDPIRGRKIRWFEHSDLKNLGVNLHALPKSPAAPLPSGKTVQLAQPKKVPVPA